MERSFYQLIDLPDEIILIILNKLDNVEVLYSLMDVNTRLNQILHDPIFTTEIILMMPTERLLHRFCLQILPKIHHQIQRFSLDLASMERVLLSGVYPNLHQLHISITDAEPIQHLTDKSTLIGIFQNQIDRLSISGEIENSRYFMIDLADFFSYILAMFTNILHLQFYKSYSYILFHNQPSLFSSTLVELHINVYCFDDLLHLLDGQLNQLHTLFANVRHILPPRSTINNKEELTNMKHFSLTSINEAITYDELVVPHLQRMLNLEKLTLSLGIDREERFVDGNDLKNNIVSYMPRLKEFIFNIRSKINLSNQIHLLSNEDIQCTLSGLADRQVISCVDYFSHEKIGRCHFYTCPYTMIHYENITNHFPGGLFECVRYVTLFDEHPFEHIFFYRIAQAFPFLTELTVCNWEPQIYKQDRDQNDNTPFCPIIKFPQLAKLHLFHIHDDYAEQFLLDTKTFLPNSIRLAIEMNQLDSVTHNFTRDATRFNCAKVKNLSIEDRSNLPKHFHLYFPLVI